MEQETVKSNQKFELDGVGEFRVKRGTAVAEIAGAATYWQNECKTAEARYETTLQRISKSKWRDGFLTATICYSVIAAVIAAVVVGISRLFF